MKPISPIGTAQGYSLSLYKGVVHRLGGFSARVVGGMFESVLAMPERYFNHFMLIQGHTKRFLGGQVL